MRKFSLLYILIVCCKTGLCDTLDYWQVFYSDSVVTNVSLENNSNVINFEASAINEKDSLIVIYSNEILCNNCRSVLFIRDEKNRKLKLKEAKSTSHKVSISLKKLYQFGQKNKSVYYNVYHWVETDEGKGSSMKYIFQMRFF